MSGGSEGDRSGGDLRSIQEGVEKEEDARYKVPDQPGTSGVQIDPLSRVTPSVPATNGTASRYSI